METVISFTIKCLIRVTFLIACFVFPSVQAQDKPNIVFILADDLGVGDLASYAHPYAETPSLDRLASEGTRFEQFYVTGAVCAPSRAGFMTAVHPAAFTEWPSKGGLVRHKTITKLLHDHGYTVGHFGKWHIGPKEAALDGEYGIDQVEVIGASRKKPGGRDAAVFDAALQFIEANSERPFYVNIWGHIAHMPVVANAEREKRFEQVEVERSDFGYWMQKKLDRCEALGCDVNDSMRSYLAEVYALDVQVGRVLETLDRLKLSGNTILVFSSDNGPAPLESKKKSWFNFLDRGKDHGLNMMGHAAGSRGGKHEHYEGGVRSPFIVRWPGRVPAGKVNSTSIISGLDWLPTLSEIVQIDLDGYRMDGESVVDIWKGASRSRRNPLFWRNLGGWIQSLRDGQWKLLVFKNGTIELYNLSSDREERVNVAGQYPDVVQRMMRQIDDWVSTLPPDRTEEDNDR